MARVLIALALLAAGCARAAGRHAATLSGSRRGRSRARRKGRRRHRDARRARRRRSTAPMPTARISPGPARGRAGHRARDPRRSSAPPSTRSRPDPYSFMLFFVFGTDTLTPESTEVLARSPARSRGGPPRRSSSSATPTGSGAISRTTSSRSSAPSASARTWCGWASTPDRIQTVGRGEREPLVPTDDEVARAAQSAGGDHRSLIVRHALGAIPPHHQHRQVVGRFGAGGEARHVLTDRLAHLADGGRRWTRPRAPPPASCGCTARRPC